MVGLPFPNSGTSNREQSWDNGTPFSSSGDIPIDPALSETPVDPALLAEEGITRSTETPQPPPLYPPYQSSRVDSYPQGPQGDPFAQPPPVYIPIEEPVPLPAKPVKKRKRPVAREEECGFCSGNDSQNKDGQPELMASMLMCDFCDRGWHMSCFNPPFREPPEGRWLCPCCRLVGSEDLMVDGIQPEQSPEIQDMLPSFPPERELSVASSSHHLPPSSDIRQVPDQELTPDASEVEADTGGRTPRKRTKGRKSRKGKEVARDGEDEQEPPTTTPMPTIRKLRIRVNSPPPPAVENETPTIRLRVPARGKGKAREDAVEEPFERGLFDDILSIDDRDIRDTTIKDGDVLRFDRSRATAEDKLVPRLLPPDPPETPIAGPSTRPLRSHTTPITPHVPSSSMSPAPSAATPGPHAMFAPNGLRIRKIRFGEFDIDTWYDAPFPEEYAAIPDGRLWMCEYCLKYMKSRFSATRHQLKCKVRHPPGDEIYRDGKTSIFEVDGRKNKIYCQNLCLLSKMFLDHKSLFYDVEPFLFYVMTETNEDGAHFVGYFSKEKLSPKNYNVSCIMTLPVRQRQGWGNLLIDFSYLLSKKEQRAGSPEKPLSALGALGYRNYWTLSLMRYLQTAPPNPQLEDISAATSMTPEDIHSTLVHLNMISVLDNPQAAKPLPGQTIKFPKGRKNGIARKHLQRTSTHDEEKPKGPFVPPTRYKVRWDADQVEEYLVRWEAKGYLKLRPEKLKWSPFILSRAHKTQSSEADGEIGKDDAEIPPSESNGITMNGVEVAKMRSPAFALFDDDNVEVVRASASRDPVPSETTDADRSRARNPSAEPVERARPKRNRTRDVDDTPSVRRLRSRDSVNESTPVGRRPRTPRGEASSRSERRKNPTRSRLDISSTPGSHSDLNGNGTVPPSLDDDAAYAARLAKELDNPCRQLRNRRLSTDQSAQTPPHIVSSPRSSSPRKRRRVDSSPEVETTPAPRASTTRRTSRRVVDTLLPYPKPTTSTPSEKSQKMTNGRPTRTSKARPSRSAIIALRQEEEEDEDEQLPANGAYTLEGHLANGYAAAEQGVDDARYDDADTPATGVTAASRHSVPSDDTMIGGDPIGLKASTPFGLVPSPALDALSVLAQVAVEDAHKYIVDFGSITRVPTVQNVADEDAEGEEDEDAEGEPDDDANM
ncbi:hypothetical protein LXA43DRAFT_1089180 [Ganoderma leucocontextum]|nr:hypothetical protein LXA43DRAFT_1089180 [Ganoderma leucocontextum]